MRNILNILIVGILSIVIVYLGYQIHVTKKILTSTRDNLASTTIAYDLKIEGLITEKNNLSNELEHQKDINNNFTGQIKEISSTVGNLEKLKGLDRELLGKYSKVFFLNEHYIPKKISLIDPQYIVSGREPEEFHGDALPFLIDMIKSAKKDGTDLTVISAYRSFLEQASLKASYKVTYGAGTANKFSAEQGYSEHQLGTAVDFSTKKLGTNYEAIVDDRAYTWLVNNAYLFGFILSYPKGNKYYIYEPWHWRFVGKALALRLHEEHENFYDMDQRDIDKYLLKIFD